MTGRGGRWNGGGPGVEHGLIGFDGQQEGCSAVPEARVSRGSPPSGFPCGEWGRRAAVRAPRSSWGLSGGCALTAGLDSVLLFI